MTLLRHSIEIETNIESAMKLIVDIKNWPKYFEPCQSIKILKDDANYQLFEITAKAKNQLMTWQSERKIDYKNSIIHFKQIQPSLLLTSMEGCWRFDALNDGVLVSLDHEFEIKENVKNLIEKIFTKEDAINYMKNAIDSNSNSELLSIKNILENENYVSDDLAFTFYETKNISTTKEEIYSYLQDLKKWPQILPHCKNLNVIYDDGENQEFVMTVRTGDTSDRYENIRSIRKCYKNKRIDYFQPNPPPILNEHQGSWVIKPSLDGICLTSWHRICLNSEGVINFWKNTSLKEASLRIKAAINKNSSSTMNVLADLIFKNKR